MRTMLRLSSFLLLFFIALCSPLVSPVQASDPTTLPLWNLNSLYYQGAFRFQQGTFGVSSMDYSDGQIEYNPSRNSIYSIGHAHQTGAIAEFSIPPLVLGTDVSALNTGANIQPFAASPLGRANETGNPQQINRITGLKLFGSKLLINAITWYDAAGDNTHTSLLLQNANDLSGSIVNGYYSYEGGAGHTAGWISPVPSEWQSLLGGTHVTASGGAMSIISRTTPGPALFIFNPERDVLGGSVASPIPTIKYIDYSIRDQWLHSDYYNSSRTNDIWTAISGATYGLIIPGTRTYLAIGYSGGHVSGVQYKGTDQCGNNCGGPCAIDCNDTYLYYWAYDLNDALKVNNGDLQAHEVRPYVYGQWPSPFGATEIKGGAFDAARGIMYLQHDGVDRGQYSRYPLILAYTFRPSGSDNVAPDEPKSLVIAP